MKNKMRIFDLIVAHAQLTFTMQEDCIKKVESA